MNYPPSDQHRNRLAWRAIEHFDDDTVTIPRGVVLGAHVIAILNVEMGTGTNEGLYDTGMAVFCDRHGGAPSLFLALRSVPALISQYELPP